MAFCDGGRRTINRYHPVECNSINGLAGVEYPPRLLIFPEGAAHEAAILTGSNSDSLSIKMTGHKESLTRSRLNSANQFMMMKAIRENVSVIRTNAHFALRTARFWLPLIIVDRLFTIHRSTPTLMCAGYQRRPARKVLVKFNTEAATQSQGISGDVDSLISDTYTIGQRPHPIADYCLTGCGTELGL